jgi:hypothetical protein
MENYKMFFVIKTALQIYLWESDTHITSLRLQFSSISEKDLGDDSLSQFDTPGRCPSQTFIAPGPRPLAVSKVQPE